MFSLVCGLLAIPRADWRRTGGLRKAFGASFLSGGARPSPMFAFALSCGPP